MHMAQLHLHVVLHGPGGGGGGEAARTQGALHAYGAGSMARRGAALKANVDDFRIGFSSRWPNPVGSRRGGGAY